MHEMALAQSLLDIIEEHAKGDAFARVLRVNLSLGALAHVDPAALKFGFDAVCRGTVAEGAELLIEVKPAKGFCMACSKEIVGVARGEGCPVCGGYQWVAMDGEEMRVIDLEVE